MATYRIGSKKVTAKDLDEAEAIAIASLEVEGEKVQITTPNGNVSVIIKKAGAKHWAHKGFTFDFVQADGVARLKELGILA